MANVPFPEKVVHRFLTVPDYLEVLQNVQLLEGALHQENVIGIIPTSKTMPSSRCVALSTRLAVRAKTCFPFLL